MRLLATGELPIDDYAALVAQHLAIYRALEEVAEHWRDDPVAGNFVIDGLHRVAALEQDLAALLGTHWSARADALRVPATDDYVRRIHDVAADWAGAFIAHHYVRYLGDLSGGQVVRAGVRRGYGPLGASAFYDFDGIGGIAQFRVGYRRLLDHALLTREQHGRVVAEARLAFELNRAVFADLGHRSALVGSGASAG